MAITIKLKNQRFDSDQIVISFVAKQNTDKYEDSMSFRITVSEDRIKYRIRRKVEEYFANIGVTMPDFTDELGIEVPITTYPSV